MPQTGAALGFFVNIYYGVRWHHLSVYHRALNNTTENDYNEKDITSRDGLLCDDPLVTRGSSACNLHIPSFFRNSTVHNEKLFGDHLRHSSHSHGVHGREHGTFCTYCSACLHHSHRSRSMKMVVMEVVEQEKEGRIRPGWGWRRWASPPSLRTWPDAFLRLEMEW